MKGTKAQITELSESKKKLEEQYPWFIQANSPQARTREAGAQPNGPTPDPAAELSQINGLQIRIKVLNNQLELIRGEASKVEQSEGLIAELTRKKELEEANYRYYAARLEQSRINEALGTGKVSNINQIQAPTVPFSDRSNQRKIPPGILLAGIALGLAWAFAIELFFDQTIRRPIDFERTIGIPLFLSIPAFKQKKLKRPFKKASTKPDSVPESPSSTITTTGSNTTALTDNWTSNEVLLTSFHETLRDRLISYFESKNITHKPKLIAVTGLDHSSGVTTTAAGLAKSLSETGDGNVLLVDMTAGQGSAQQFYQGKAVCGLDEVLSLRGSAQVQDNLYVVSEEPSSERLSRILPHRFTKLVPQLKASNFEYIIFDMPAVSQLSITPRLASFMDMVLLVIESEKTNRDIVQRATALLAQSKTPIGAILNKSNSYIPPRLHQDGLRDI